MPYASRPDLPLGIGPRIGWKSAGGRAAGICCFLAAAVWAQGGGPKFRVLYYNKSPVGAAYVHTSAIAAMKDSVLSWGKTYGFTVDVGADATVMTAANLAKYQTVIFDNVSSETADAFPQASQRAALLDYMKTGGFVGIHAAAEAGRWPDLVSLLGAKMTIHTSETNELTAALNVDAGVASHPLVTGMAGTGSKLALPGKVSLVDEWYSYTASPRSIAGVKILYTLDEKTFVPAAAMGDHPIAWIRDMAGGGRMFYTGMGHSAPYLAQPFIRSLLVNAIFWSAGEGTTAVAPGAGRAAPGGAPAGGFSAQAAEPGRITVRAEGQGNVRVTVRTVSGNLAARAAGRAGENIGIGGLRARAYMVGVDGPSGHAARLVIGR